MKDNWGTPGGEREERTEGEKLGDGEREKERGESRERNRGRERELREHFSVGLEKSCH